MWVVIRQIVDSHADCVVGPFDAEPTECWIARNLPPGDYEVHEVVAPGDAWETIERRLEAERAACDTPYARSFASLPGC